MNNKSLQSVLVLLVLFPISVMAISMPAQAMNLSMSPPLSVVSFTYAYSATMDPQTVPPGGFFLLNATIPAGYKFTFPAAGETIANYTMFNNTANSNQVIINITSNDSIAETVDVRYSTNYGLTYSTSTNQSINNIVIGVSTLKITKPGPSTPGYLNWSLGGTAGPILVQDKVTLKLPEQVLWNPADPGNYTWYVEAKNNPAGTAYTASDVVVVGILISFQQGWNQISIPVNTSTPLGALFAGVPGYTQTWAWNRTNQGYVSVGGSAPVVGQGYFVFASGAADVIIRGTGMTLNYNQLNIQHSCNQPECWNMVGPGINAISTPDWAYHWFSDTFVYGYSKIMIPGMGYWILG
jgi:hypothetical protein